MRLHWISLLPPLDAAPARLAVQALHALSEVREVVVWAAQESWDPALEACGRVRPLGPDLWRETNRGEPLIALLGEEVENAAVLQLCRHHVDVMVLHGSRFGQLLQSVDGDAWPGSRGTGDGRDAVCALAAVGKGPALLCHVEGLVPAGGQGGQVVHRPPPFAPDTPWDAASALAAAPRRVLVRSGPLDLLASFLHVAASVPGADPLEVVVAGAAGPPAGFRENARTHCQWDPTPFYRLVHQVDRFGLAVLLETGDTPCLDQLALWSRSAPTVAPAAGWHRDQPIDTYAPLRPGHEPRDLEVHLRDWLRFPAEYRALGLAGRRHLEDRHSPVVWRDRLLELAARAMEATPARALRPLADRLEMELRSWPATAAVRASRDRLRSRCARLVAAASADVRQEVD